MLPSSHATRPSHAAASPAAWNDLPDELQLTLSREALKRAAQTLADHAELLAGEMEVGTLLDQGGPDALRLFAAVIRATNKDDFDCVGNA
ncbi:hypothetical protein [Muricoccus radiodurans]|uniref:hypothetical protein n=1 Tax=Muricoccus radiodurans TaxID=2231721 RepID=UPI003CE7BB10